MTGAKDGGPSDFESAMSDAKPLEGRDAVRPAPKTVRRRRRVADGEPRRFEIDRIGERVEGRMAGIDAGILRKLRNGGIPRDARVDLHGMTATQARASVRDAVASLRDAGGRCLLVIHGRGRHSEGEPVLKDALIDWLAEPPLGDQVMAFASATGGDGGVGATYVLLRRDRDG